MFHAEGIYKIIEDNTILHNIHMTIEPGSILGLIGPNGSGKSTLLQCIAGIYQIDAGILELCNQPIFDNPKTKRWIGYVPTSNHLYATYTVSAMVRFYQKAYPDFDAKFFLDLNQVFAVPMRGLIGKLSRQMQLKLSIMLALSIRPKLLLLDEPITGLDAMSTRTIVNLLLSEVSNRNTSILFASHDIKDVESISNSLSIIQNGSITYSQSTDVMRATFSSYHFVVQEKLSLDISMIEGVVDYRTTGTLHQVITTNKPMFLEAMKTIHPLFIEEVPLGLEDVYRCTIGGVSNHEQSSVC